MSLTAAKVEDNLKACNREIYPNVNILKIKMKLKAEIECTAIYSNII